MVSKPRTYRELRIDGRFSQDEWAFLLAEVKADLKDPSNSIGLGGPSQYGQAWDDWLDDYLDGGIGERYWGAGKSRMWDFGTNPNAIRKFMKSLVGTAAGIERGKQIARSKRQTRQAVVEKVISEEGEESVEIGEEIQEPGDTKEEETESGDEDRGGNGNGNGEGEGEDKEEERGEGEGKEVKEADGEGEDSLLGGRSLLPEPSGTNSMKHELTFQTRLVSSNKIKFIYLDDTTSLQAFIRKVREKFCLKIHETIANIEAEIGGKIYVVDLRDERDWQQIVKISKKSNGAEIVVTI